jgi:superfamily II DNA/RNA helicase
VATHVPKTFAELNVLPATVEALAEDGIITAFPIQELTLPLALAGNDLIGQAKTGTGKTLGFGIPALPRRPTTSGRPTSTRASRRRSSSSRPASSASRWRATSSGPAASAVSA